MQEVHEDVRRVKQEVDRLVVAQAMRDQRYTKDLKHIKRAVSKKDPEKIEWPLRDHAAFLEMEQRIQEDESYKEQLVCDTDNVVVVLL